MDSIWNAHIVDSAAVRLHLNDSSWDWMLGIATRKWREVLRDQWDVRDLDWRNDTEAAAKLPGAVDAGVRPFVNSHYSRQLLGIWALVAGLSPWLPAGEEADHARELHTITLGRAGAEFLDCFSLAALPTSSVNDIREPFMLQNSLGVS